MEFFFLFGKKASEIVIMLWEAFKKSALGTTLVYESYSRFKRKKIYLKTNHNLAALQQAKMTIFFLNLSPCEIRHLTVEEVSETAS